MSSIANLAFVSDIQLTWFKLLNCYLWDHVCVNFFCSFPVFTFLQCQSCFPLSMPFRKSGKYLASNSLSLWVLNDRERQMFKFWSRDNRFPISLKKWEMLKGVGAHSKWPQFVLEIASKRIQFLPIKNSAQKNDQSISVDKSTSSANLDGMEYTSVR